MKIKLSKSQWQIIGRKAGWIKTSDNDVDDILYKSTYGVPVPDDHKVDSRHLKTYRISQFAEIEKYDDGYFAVVNLIHGTQVFWTRKFEDAKNYAKEVGYYLK